MNADLHLEIASPAHFDRGQLVLRIVLAIALGWLGITLGGVASALYVALPLLAAVAISASGRDRYIANHSLRLETALEWILRYEAYMMLLVDRPPTAEDADGLAIEIHPSGAPTVGSALLRLLTSVPSAIVGIALGLIAGLLWLPGALWILAGARVPHRILAYQRGVLRWHAGVLAYHASLVADYPRWTFDTHDHVAAAA